MTVVHLFHSDNFLGFFKLETGGTIIGVIGILYALIQFIFEAILFFPLIFAKEFCSPRNFIYDTLGNLSKGAEHTFPNYALEGLENFTQNFQEGIQNVTGSDHNCSSVSKIPFGILLFVLIVVNLLSIFVHYKLIKGVEEFDSSKLYLARKFYLFFIIIRIILALLGLIWMLFWLKMMYVSILSLVLLLVDIYFFKIIDNLHNKYKYFHPTRDIMQTTPLKKIPEEDVEV